MDETVRAEYESILAEVVIERGKLVGFGCESDEYAWEDWDSDNPHLAECGVAEHRTPVESAWEEFVGTLAEPTHETHHGVDLPGVTCTCGRLTDRTFRMEQPVQEVAEAVFTKLYQRTH